MIALREKKKEEVRQIDQTKVCRGHFVLPKRIHQDRRTNRLRTRSAQNRKAINES